MRRARSVTLNAMFLAAAVSAFIAAGFPSGGLDASFAAPASAPRLYVDPAGNDRASGIKGRPVKTLARALLLAKKGPAVIEVNGGTTPQLQDATQRTGMVEIKAKAGTRPRIGALSVQRGQKLSFTGFTFNSVGLLGATDVAIASSSVAGVVMVAQGPGQPFKESSRISLVDNAIEAPGRTCVTVRASSDVTLEGNRIENCVYGIAGPGNAPPSSGVVIRDNRLQDFVGDGISFGDWSDVVIDRNVITRMDDPADKIHNDAIQFYGDSSRVRITNNHLSRSEGQLMLIQDSIGPIDDVLVENNVIQGAAAYAVQSQGATRTRFVNNTIWNSRYGGLLLRGGKRGTAPTDTVVSRNILAGYEELKPVSAAVRTSNVVAKCPPKPISGVECAADVAFVDPSIGNFDLAPGSRLRSDGVGAHLSGR